MVDITIHLWTYHELSLDMIDCLGDFLTSLVKIALFHLQIVIDKNEILNLIDIFASKSPAHFDDVLKTYSFVMGIVASFDLPLIVGNSFFDCVDIWAQSSVCMDNI